MRRFVVFYGSVVVVAAVVVVAVAAAVERRLKTRKRFVRTLTTWTTWMKVRNSMTMSNGS
jgi:urea transporter